MITTTTSPLLTLFQSHGHELKASGKSYVTKCPFHDDDKPSLSVTPEKGLWHCFGCGAGGDGITYLERALGLTFGEAADQWRALSGQSPKHLHSKPAHNTQSKKKEDDIMNDTLKAASIRPASKSSEPSPQRSFNSADLKIMNRLQDIYARDLANNKAALAYLQQRGITNFETIRAFGLGYVTGHGLPELAPEQRERLQDLGILNQKGNETLYGCIVCPLYNQQREVVSFWGRSCGQQMKGPAHRCLERKLQNVPRATVNLPALRGGERIVLVEGFLDAVACHQAGIRNAIPAGSCTVCQDLLELFSQEDVREVWVAFDLDTAGDEGALKAGLALDRRGIASVRVAPDHDPADFFLNGGTAKIFRDLATRGEILGRGSDDSEFLLDSNGLLYRARLCAGAGQNKGKLKAQVLVSPASPDPHSPPIKHRDVLNLYVHKTRKAFCNCCAAQFQTSSLTITPAQVEADLQKIIEGLERRERQKLEPKSSHEQHIMSPEEEAEAKSYLEAPNLVSRLQADMKALGYVGEEEAKLLVYLIGTSRKLPKPLSGIIQSGSGAGKSFLAGLVEQLMPPEDVIMLSRLSPQALFYMPSDFAVRKVLMLEERAGGEAADYAIRSLQSKDELTQLITMKDPTTGQMSTKMFKVEGPIAYLETTTENYLNPENTSRCFEIPLDESSEQTRRIHDHQRRSRALSGLKNTLSKQTVRSIHHCVQRVLRPVHVVIPFAQLLEFPVRYLRTRRDHERFLSLIEASAFLHQFQRDLHAANIDGREVQYIEATIEDYTLAYSLALKVLWVSLDELSRWGRELLNYCRHQVEEAQKDQPQMRTPDFHWTRRQLRESLGWMDKRMRSCVEELTELEYFQVLSGGKGKTFVYSLNPDFSHNPKALGLLTPDQLKEKINRQRDPAQSRQNKKSRLQDT